MDSVRLHVPALAALAALAASMIACASANSFGPAQDDADVPPSAATVPNCQSRCEAKASACAVDAHQYPYNCENYLCNAGIGEAGLACLEGAECYEVHSGDKLRAKCGFSLWSKNTFTPAVDAGAVADARESGVVTPVKDSGVVVPTKDAAPSCSAIGGKCSAGGDCCSSSATSMIGCEIRSGSSGTCKVAGGGACKSASDCYSGLRCYDKSSDGRLRCFP